MFLLFLRVDGKVFYIVGLEWEKILIEILIFFGMIIRQRNMFRLIFVYFKFIKFEIGLDDVIFGGLCFNFVQFVKC